MLGLTDLSLIPSSAIQNIAIASGSGNTSYGEKGGGSIFLKTKNPTNEIGTSQAFGSFGKTITESFAGFKYKNWKLSLFTRFENSDNNYIYATREFSNQAGVFIDVEKKRENNELSSKTGILNLSWQKNQKEFFSTLWLYDASNNIPGGISSPSPEATQKDSYFRFMNRYSTKIYGKKFTSKFYINRQQLDFINPASNINSLSTSNTLSGDFELELKLNQKLEVITSSQIGYSFVNASDYADIAKRTQVSIQSHPVWNLSKRITFFSGIRLDYYSDFKEAFSINMGTNIRLIANKLYLKGQLSRNFVAPTFNDLYWPGLGNQELQPETNLQSEGGLIFQQVFPKIYHSIELIGYKGLIKDGIRWLPDNNGQSRPENLEEVGVSGFEIKNKLTFQYDQLQLEINSILLHSVASLQEARFDGDRAEGKQLRYTPEWLVKLNTKFIWKNLGSIFYLNFTEERFTTADHSSPFDPLPSYSDASWSTFLNIEKGNFRFSPQFTVQNLFDKEYTIIRDYPMPGRNYLVKLTIKYKLR
ncbi:MAG: TonB-dependent receptor [Balneolaceae bacterium]